MKTLRNPIIPYLAVIWLANTAASQSLERVSAGSLNLPAEPPKFGFTTESALGNISFSQPLAVVVPPGETNRIFVVEQPGRIMVIPDLTNPSASVFLDIRDRVGSSSGERGLLAMAFHPDYATNGYFYVWYTTTTTTDAGSGLHDRLARFQVSNDPNVANPDSEQPLITQRDQASNHNGGDIHFGPDGYLYLSLGDEGGANDDFQNGQRIDRDFFSAMLRIDVDKKPGSLPPNAHPAVHAGTYSIPPDNPFIGATSFDGQTIDPAQVRTEIWAIGLRNPFRFSFDPATRQLWLGDVGQGSREEIDIIERGGNYGWPYREGKIAGPRSNPPVGSTFVDPIYEYAHGNGWIAVTGGIVYRGSALSQLYGKYIFADFGTAEIWALAFDGVETPNAVEITSDGGIAGFGTNPLTGDLIFADAIEGRIKRIVYNETQTGTPFPERLSETGAFSSLNPITPAPGVVTYEPAVSFWSDHALKSRWFALQNDTDTFGFSPEGNWSLPTGAVWVKHFDLEMTRGEPSSARRIETRFLVKTEDGVYGLTYEWNDEQTEAFLVEDKGKSKDFLINEHGDSRTQTWRFPGRAECLTCHTPHGGWALSFNTRQLNRSHTFPGGTDNVIEALAEAGYLTDAPPSVSALPALAAADDAAAPLDLRVRSYLDANCAQCHQPGGTALGTWDARFSSPHSIAGIIGGELYDTGGDPENRVIVPGSSAHSRLLHRVAATNGATRMPPLATGEPDTAAEELLMAWIAELDFAEPSPRLANLSGRAETGVGDDILIPSFVIIGEDPKPVLIRAIGPELSAFGVEGALSSPVLRVFSGSDEIAANAGWSTAANADQIQSTAELLGAFALPDASADSAVLITLPPGAYTAQASGLGGTTGVSLVEVYDASETVAQGSSRLVNTALRARVGGDAGVLIPGLVIREGAPVTVLARAIGPSLIDFGVQDSLGDPVLTLFSGSDPLVINEAWSSAQNAADISRAAQSIGAFDLEVGTRDAAILITLLPGSYTLHVASKDTSEGVVLVEVYEIP